MSRLYADGITEMRYFSAQASRSSQHVVRDLQLVHRRVRYQRLTRGEGTIRGVNLKRQSSSKSLSLPVSFSTLLVKTSPIRANGIKLTRSLVGRGPSTSLRVACPEPVEGLRANGVGKLVDNCPFVLSVAAPAAKSKHGFAP